MTYKITLPLIMVAALSACELPDESTLNRSDLRAFAADDIRASKLDFTPAADIPTGAATYTGHIRSDAIVNGESDYSILGLMDLDVTISSTATRDGSGRISGEISDINLIDNNNDSFDDQAFGGKLTISGDAREGRIDATATGVLDAVLDDTFSKQTSTWSLDMKGDFVTDVEDGDTITGTLTGGTTGTASDEYDVLLTGTGRFLGERE